MIDDALAQAVETMKVAVPTRPSFVGDDDRIFPVPMPLDDDDVLPAAFPTRRRDALGASFERSKTRPRGNPWAFLRAPLVTPASYALQLGRAHVTHLESRNPALRRCILALHVVHVYRFVLALIVEPTAQ